MNSTTINPLSEIELSIIGKSLLKQEKIIVLNQRTIEKHSDFFVDAQAISYDNDYIYCNAIFGVTIRDAKTINFKLNRKKND